jgi:hypothetical protein
VEEAIRFYRMAAEQGLPQGQMSLALIYSEADGVKRDGVEKDEVEAMKWLFALQSDIVRPAGLLEDEENFGAAVNLFRSLRHQLPPERVQEAKTKAEAWRNGYVPKTDCYQCPGKYDSRDISIEVVGHGRYESTPENELPLDPQHDDWIRLIEKTDTVSCQIGERFGIRFEARAPKVVDEIYLDIVWEHPPLYAPQLGLDGPKSGGFGALRIQDGRSQISNSIWRIADPRELVAGEYRVSLQSRGTELAHHTFRVEGCLTPL